MPMQPRRWTTALAAAGLLAACSEPPSGPGPEAPRPLSAAERQVVAGSNTFAWGLLREAGRGQPGRNVFVSPLSVSMALGMTTAGARGTTEREMQEALGFGGMTREEMGAAYRGLKDLLPGLDRQVEMRVANSVWYRQGFPFEQGFPDHAARWFDAEVEGLDFDSPAARERINAWVKEETRGRIPGIVDQIDSDDVMFLVNAVYFKAPWTSRFDRSRTREGDFRRRDGSTVRVPMMYEEKMPVRFASNGRFSAADLPYGNGAFAMTVVVPHPMVSVDEVAAGLNAEAWGALVASLREDTVVVTMPRLKLEWKDDLKTALQALGIRQAFVDGGADFTGMSASRGTALFVSQVLHKTFLEVNEEGTEAAGATSVGISVTSLPPGIYADRPFLLAIRERSSGAVIFLGKVEDPR